jgi:hypothetical protein
MLALNRSLLNKEYILMDVLKALASSSVCAISMSFSYQILHLDSLHCLLMGYSVHST